MSSDNSGSPAKRQKMDHSNSYQYGGLTHNIPRLTREELDELRKSICRPPFGFCDLPLEVRQQIYREAWLCTKTASKRILVFDNGNEQESIASEDSHQSDSFMNGLWAFAQACKLTHDEILPLVYKGIHFCVHSLDRIVWLDDWNARVDLISDVELSICTYEGFDEDFGRVMEKLSWGEYLDSFSFSICCMEDPDEGVDAEMSLAKILHAHWPRLRLIRRVNLKGLEHELESKHLQRIEEAENLRLHKMYPR
ncbi:hypothetical protein KVT40_003233 [Elsinoe batatas]|uniref:Uncharacterized protein n=1 Tax=Elsinoe batatas TaxID=2601811 RepID=A0A8K0PJB8_9PEZI|nr:hypothetical protein KVT40_003233 [Elsinoe batatas]